MVIYGQGPPKTSNRSSSGSGGESSAPKPTTKRVKVGGGYQIVDTRTGRTVGYESPPSSDGGPSSYEITHPEGKPLVYGLVKRPDSKPVSSVGVTQEQAEILTGQRRPKANYGMQIEESPTKKYTIDIDKYHEAPYYIPGVDVPTRAELEAPPKPDTKPESQIYTSSRKLMAGGEGTLNVKKSITDYFSGPTTALKSIVEKGKDFSPKDYFKSMFRPYLPPEEQPKYWREERPPLNVTELTEEEWKAREGPPLNYTGEEVAKMVAPPVVFEKTPEIKAQEAQARKETITKYSVIAGVGASFGYLAYRYPPIGYGLLGLETARFGWTALGPAIATGSTDPLKGYAQEYTKPEAVTFIASGAMAGGTLYAIDITRPTFGGQVAKGIAGPKKSAGFESTEFVTKMPGKNIEVTTRGTGAYYAFDINPAVVPAGEFHPYSIGTFQTGTHYTSTHKLPGTLTKIFGKKEGKVPVIVAEESPYISAGLSTDTSAQGFKLSWGRGPKGPDSRVISRDLITTEGPLSMTKDGVTITDATGQFGMRETIRGFVGKQGIKESGGGSIIQEIVIKPPKSPGTDISYTPIKYKSTGGTKTPWAETFTTTAETYTTKPRTKITRDIIKQTYETGLKEHRGKVSTIAKTSAISTTVPTTLPAVISKTRASARTTTLIKAPTKTPIQTQIRTPIQTQIRTPIQTQIRTHLDTGFIRTPTSTVVTGIGIGVPPPRPPPPPPPIKIGIPGWLPSGGFSGRRKKKGRLKKQPLKYTPNLGAVIFNIKGTPPAKLTGLELRPIPLTRG